MATTTKFGAMRNTVGGAFNGQVIGGCVMGVNASGAITEGMSILEGVSLNNLDNYDALPVERNSTVGIYRTRKILSGGAFLYNAAVNRTFVIARMATSLAGVANNNLLFMAQAVRGIKSVHDFNHDVGVRMLTLWVANRFSWTGKLANGSSKASRSMWLNADGTAVATPTSLGTVFMRDLADGNASDKAKDHAVMVSTTAGVRAIPGEYFLLNDFVTAGLSGGNFFDYKPITGF